jgi:hypothetical protein
MLSVTSYPKTYVDGCRAKLDAQISAYQDVVGAASGGKRFDAALATFEPLFSNNMVMVLDNFFLHRSRNMELKDGNPLNEVRILCNSMRDNDGSMAADTQIKLDPATSVLGYGVGDEITLSVQGFQRLAAAFFEEIERKYP